MTTDRQEIRRVTGMMNELLYEEKMMWLHSSIITWMKRGGGQKNEILPEQRCLEGEDEQDSGTYGK